MTRRPFATVALAAVLLVTAAACSEDKDSASGSSASGASASGAAASGSAAEAACDPVGDGGGTPVAVTLGEWKVEVDKAEAPAGKVTFTISNEGAEPHELVVVKADSIDDLKVVDGKVDEEALPKGAFIGEVEAFPSGEDCKGTFELDAGKYILFCNIVEDVESGAHESHFEEGMHTTFTVT
jgi:hypothetical protein